MKKLAVVALGGNALLRGDQIGTIEEQEKNTKDTLENLLYLIKEGYGLVIGHGNGPQVGNILMRNDAGEEMYDIPQMPLDICVADSQGGIGYMIERMLRNVLMEHNIQKDIVTMVTQVVVNKDDGAFNNPTKRVGKIYTKEQANELNKSKGWIFKESPKLKDGWRRVVASPEPLEVFNAESIEALARQGTIVIAAGGGGVPVYVDDEKNIRPLEAVIDKDKATSLLATTIKADEFYILTDVPYVYIDYRQHNEKKLDFLNKADAEKYMKEGKFGEGNMSPKINAAIRFVENGGSKSVITEATKLADKSVGTKITLE
ncbi:MAG: carbamate kinase [Bacteroidetes bacterium 4572_117]|nr:MAG: carbamate kinase [Bacteroidetes bacterium 4572_117]